MRRHFLRPSLSMVVACIALSVALAGTTYAAIKLPKNSVGRKQIKNNAVTTAKVKNGSLKAADFKSGQLPAGAQGARGLTGATGAAGSALAFGRVRSGGTLDTSRFKNISIVPGHPDDGTYCLIVPPTARNLSVVGDLSDGASNDTIFASLARPQLPATALPGLATRSSTTSTTAGPRTTTTS